MKTLRNSQIHGTRNWLFLTSGLRWRFQVTLLAGLSSVCLRYEACAQTFFGTNAPGTAQDFAFTIAPGATNLSVTVAGTATNFSHLLLKKGGTPSDSDFDFIAQLDGVTNAINLELPELVATNYGLRVRTPTNSLAHEFVVTLATNLAGMRSASWPVSKPQATTVTGTLTNGQFHYFRFEIPTNSPGWRLVLNSPGTNAASLYVRRDALPDSGSFDRAVTGLTNATVVFTEAQATPGAYFVGVYEPAGANAYTLYSEVGYFGTLTWDPGLTPKGTQVHTNTSPTGGDYYFKISTQTPNAGAWRTTLAVLSGEAGVSIRKGALPDGNNDVAMSDRTGSDGFVLHSSQFSAAEEWYIRVHASPSAQWTLVTGDVFVYDLGPLAADGSSSTNAVIGPEGMIFFKSTVSADTLGWRLWLNGAANTVYVRKSFAPHPISFDLAQSGKMLVVPPYLAAGTFNGYYFVAVPGNPGALVNLDSRKHAVTDLAFNTTTNVIVAGADFPYRTFRVQVPVQQIAWQITASSDAGDANLAVRRDRVPNEFHNDAVSDVAGAADSITLAPSTPPGQQCAGGIGLSDGTFYVTVYGAGAFSASLVNGNPDITPVGYVFQVTNDAPSRVGWRYYKVENISEQLGSLGWDLLLASQPPGTEIALRRNAVPARWHFRDAENLGYSVGCHVDFSSVTGFLQQPSHQADIWYIGVYSPMQALGNFVLTGDQLVGPPVDFDGGSSSVTNQAAGRWRFFRFDVPANTQGWDLRLVNVTAGSPKLVLRRDQLPNGLSLFNPDCSCGYLDLGWPSGQQLAADLDLTGRRYSPSGATDEGGRVLSLGALPQGRYYAGVLDSSSVSSYKLQSRRIGSGFGLDVTPLAFTNGSASNTLAAREAAYYSVTVPSNAPSWRLKLTVTNGDEALLMVQKGALPSLFGGAKMQKTRNEHYALLPAEGQTNLEAGVYYLAVVSEGAYPTNDSRIGSGSTSFLLESLGALPVSDLGTVGGSDLVVADSLEVGERKAYEFTMPAGVEAVELRLDDLVGNPSVALRFGTNLPSFNYYGALDYGVSGGWGSGVIYWPFLTGPLALPNPAAGTYQLIVRSSYPLTAAAAGYTLRIRQKFSELVSFDGAGGSVPVTNQETGTWRYFRIDVPTNALGWDLRLVNVTNGNPQMVVRRDTLPESLSSTFPDCCPQGPNYYLDWPSGAQWAAGADWTDYANTPEGANAHVQTIAAGMGNPLEPGTYYVGVYADGASSYSLQSRGIGEGFTLPVSDLSFAGGSATNTLPAREAAYYRVNIPSNTPSWKVKLTVTGGDALLKAQKDYLPIVASSGYQSVAYGWKGGKKMQKAGHEHLVLLPQDGRDNIPAGTYYLVVVSEGVNPSPGQSRIGAGSSDYSLTSLGTLPVLNLGAVNPVDLVWTNALEGGEVAACQFTVPSNTLSMEVRLENRVGNPGMSLLASSRLPQVVWQGYTYGGDYGNEGGASGGTGGFNLITVANPLAGPHSLTVFGYASDNGVYSNANYTLRVHAVTAAEVTFDDGASSMTNVPAGEWRYFHLQVPTNALGWDVRLVDVTNGNPQMVVRPDTLPVNLNTTFSPYWDNNPPIWTSWPNGAQWGAGGDRTGYANAPDGSYAHVQMLAMGMGNPLQPGSYYIGVYDGSSASSYTLQSRGIGAGLSIPVNDLSFQGPASSTNVTGLPAREAAYYRVNIPSNTPSWQIKLTPSSGDALLLAQKDYLPSGAGAADYLSSATYGFKGGKKLQKAGNEHFVLLAQDGQTNTPAGTYYLAVVSEGVNPTTSNSRIGTGSSDYTVASLGALPILNLGTLNAVDLVASNAFEGGEMAAYQFVVLSNTLSMEVRLEGREGNPRISMRQIDRIVSPAWGTCGNSAPIYGASEGGQYYTAQDYSLITLANPAPGTYSVTVGADRSDCQTVPDASYTFRVRKIVPLDLNFSSQLNTNGGTNVASGVLADNQRAFFRMAVPATVNGAPVLGWKLDLEQGSGSASVRVRKNLLPEDGSDATPFATDSAIITPPYLTLGTWYVEVKGSNNTDFTLISSAIATNTLNRNPWTMPAVGQTNVATGLSLPEIGDTGTDDSGNPLPGVDLEQGRFHFYAVIVPTNNAGLLRTELQATSGDPNLYIRVGAAPTITYGDIYDRSLLGMVTEYGNWVPLNGRTETSLPPGTWVLGVHAAGNSNVRYRLKLKCGNAGTNENVQDLALDGGSFTNQELAGGDWRYYRVQIPSNAPVNWNVNFSQQSGDVRLFLRDTSPPGQTAYNALNTYWIADWADDAKNQGPYPNFDPPGAYTLTTPPLRPGHTYYLGFRAVNDATFSVSSSISGGAINITNIIPFYGGFVTSTIPAGGVLRYRIDVPSEATRWKHTSTHAAGVNFTLEQGTTALPSGPAHWTSPNQPNSSLNVSLASGAWPWLPGYSYFLNITNTLGSPQSFSFTMDGRNLLTEDENNDGLPDYWQNRYFGYYWNPLAAPNADPDGDGLSNLREFQLGSNPTNSATVPRLIALAVGGGQFHMVLVGEPGLTYGIQRSSNLSDWADAATLHMNSGQENFSDAVDASAGRAFYRAVFPAAGASRPRLTAPLLSGGTFHLTLLGEVGHTYRIQHSSDLTNWYDLTNVFLSTGTTEVTDPAAGSLPQRFYRGLMLLP